jgi:CubicO group peptidase (beta-lactamase class C family)
MNDLSRAIDEVADRTGFAGVVRVDRAGEPLIARAWGLADRAHGIANTVETQFATASGVKSMTALVIVDLIDQGLLQLSTTARSLLGDELPLIDDVVTIEHLLSHRSGIGDYLDEDEGEPLSNYLMTRPVHELVTTTDFLPMLQGHPQKFEPGQDFSYCNGGFIVLALLAERVAGAPYHDLVRQRVCARAGMVDTDFLRSDELPGRAATGYLEAGDSLRTNVFHLPVVGNGDGGIYTTAADVRALWISLFDGRIVPPAWVEQMVRPISDVPSEGKRYGLGFWLDKADDGVVMEGYDTGASFRSVHRPTTGTTHTVISNTTDGAWPVSRLLLDQLRSV